MVQLVSKSYQGREQVTLRHFYLDHLVVLQYQRPLQHRRRNLRNLRPLHVILVFVSPLLMIQVATVVERLVAVVVVEALRVAISGFHLV